MPGTGHLSLERYPYLQDKIETLDELSALSLHTYEATILPILTDTTTNQAKKRKRTTNKPKKLDINIHDITHDKNDKTNEIQHKSSSHLSNTDSNTNLLLKLPTEMAKYVNSGDFDSLSELINNTFLPNTTIQTSAMRAPEGGREKVLELFVSASRALPGTHTL